MKERPRKNSGLSQKARVFFTGIISATRRDRSVAVQMIVSVTVLAIVFWFREWIDVLLILIATGFMLTSEIFNTVIESICDYIQPEYDERIGQIKDIAAFATGISIIVWVITIFYEVARVLGR